MAVICTISLLCNTMDVNDTQTDMQDVVKEAVSNTCSEISDNFSFTGESEV